MHVAAWYQGTSTKAHQTTWEHVSIDQIPKLAKFNRAPPNGVREKRYNFYALHYFGTPEDPLGQSSPIRVW